jgi:ATP-dependent Lon protease
MSQSSSDTRGTTSVSRTDVRATEMPVPEVIPVIPSGSTIVYPQQLMPVLAAEERDVNAINAAASAPGKMLAIFSHATSAPVTGDEPQSAEPVHQLPELRRIGTAATVVRMAKSPDGTVHAILQGAARIRLIAIEEDGPLTTARVEALPDSGVGSLELEAGMRDITEAFTKVVNLSDALPAELATSVADIREPGALADFIAANLPLKSDDRYAILAALNVPDRLKLVAQLLDHEREVLEVQSKIHQDVKGELDKRQREFILREQLRAIQKELGEETTPELSELRRKLADCTLPESARKEADRELQRLAQIPSISPEYQVVRTYLEWLADLPWNTGTQDSLDVKRAAEVLDEDHYGLDKVKRRILDYLAVLKLKGGETKGPILCFTGPPGVGKTSLGISIARALGRKFIRVSLGGLRDEAEIRGHRRTYVGAMPGRVIQEIRRAGSNNPLMMLDEIDKLGADFRGDPASALLEVLDPAQNGTFTDHYLDVPFDLSHTFFVATANMQDMIPAALLDRMEIIELPGYTEHEKLEIARRYLLPRQTAENGVPDATLKVTEAAMREIIRSYTREAGVRNLERELGSVCRGVARRVAEGNTAPIGVTPDNLADFLGPPRYRWELAGEKDEVGVVAGLAATMAGGDVLFVEVTAIPGKGRLILTGKLGDVMQESAQAALTYARSRATVLSISPIFFDHNDLHVHVPAGAVPKDGPSAGVTIAAALVSVMTRRPVHKDVAMTGEITLRGKVLPVGAVRDKVLAAHRAGCRRVILPRENENDLRDVPADVRRDLEIIQVDSVDQVLDAALHEHARDDGGEIFEHAAAS